MPIRAFLFFMLAGVSPAVVEAREAVVVVVE